MQQKTKIAFFDVELWEKEYIKNQLHGIEVDFFSEKCSPEQLDKISDCQIISVFVNSMIDKEIIEKLPNLKMIATRSTGFDHIDMEFCKQRQITVCNVPSYGENTVAEHTFALLLDLSRKIHQSIEIVKKDGFSPKGLTGFDLKGKTIGIVGMGHIGQHVARIANGFEMNIIVSSMQEDKKIAKKLGFTYVTFNDVLKNSDIITFHIPYNKDTHHLINMDNINLIKRGAYIINTARGGIIETDALVKALANGMVAGAGLDVLEEESSLKEEAHFLSAEFLKTHNVKTMLENHVLMERENVIITPHNAYNSKEALERILETTSENIQAFIKNKPTNIVI